MSGAGGDGLAQSLIASKHNRIARDRTPTSVSYLYMWNYKSIPMVVT